MMRMPGQFFEPDTLQHVCSKFKHGFVAGKYDQPPEVLEEKVMVKLNKHLEIFFQRLTEKYTFN